MGANGRVVNASQARDARASPTRTQAESPKIIVSAKEHEPVTFDDPKKAA